MRLEASGYTVMFLSVPCIVYRQAPPGSVGPIVRSNRATKGRRGGSAGSVESKAPIQDPLTACLTSPQNGAQAPLVPRGYPISGFDLTGQEPAAFFRWWLCLSEASEAGRSGLCGKSSRMVGWGEVTLHFGLYFSFHILSQKLSANSHSSCPMCEETIAG